MKMTKKYSGKVKNIINNKNMDVKQKEYEKLDHTNRKKKKS